MHIVNVPRLYAQMYILHIQPMYSVKHARFSSSWAGSKLWRDLKLEKHCEHALLKKDIGKIEISKNIQGWVIEWEH